MIIVTVVIIGFVGRLCEREWGNGVGHRTGPESSLNGKGGAPGRSAQPGALRGLPQPALRVGAPFLPPPPPHPLRNACLPPLCGHTELSLSRSRPLAELFDAKNRFFHRKTQRKMVLGAKGAAVWGFLSSFEGSGTPSGGSVLWARFSRSRRNARGRGTDQHLREDVLWPE